MAAMVPMGMDFWASRRSPERLEPAMIPEEITATITPVNSRGGDEEMKAVATLDEAAVRGGGAETLTRHRGEVDADQQRKEAGDVGQHVAVRVGQGVVGFLRRVHVGFGNQIPLLIVGPKQVLCARARGM